MTRTRCRMPYANNRIRMTTTRNRYLRDAHSSTLPIPGSLEIIPTPVRAHRTLPGRKHTHVLRGQHRAIMKTNQSKDWKPKKLHVVVLVHDRNLCTPAMTRYCSFQSDRSDAMLSPCWKVLSSSTSPVYRPSDDQQKPNQTVSRPVKMGPD